MKNKGCWIGILCFIIIIGLVVVVFNVIKQLGIFFGGVVLIGAWIIIQAIAADQADRKKEQIKQEAEQQAKQQKQDYAELIKLVDEYVQTPNHSEQENIEVWEKYNNLLQEYGVEKEGPVFQIYHNVYSFLYKKIPVGLSEEHREEWITFCLTFVAKLWDFYYQVAFTYDLTPEKQEDLLQYLAQCFSRDEEDVIFAETRR